MSIYKQHGVKDKIFQLYDEKLSSLNVKYQEMDISTSYGNTHVIRTGDTEGKKIVIFHGINAGAPVALEAVKELGDNYDLYAIDTIGQATKSDENILDVSDQSLAIWADEVVCGLGLGKADFIGISYGAFILQKLITYRPERVGRCIFVVPSGLVNGKILRSVMNISLPLIRFMITQKDAHLKSFLKNFIPDSDTYMLRLQKEILLGVKTDFRRPRLLNANDVSHFDNPVYMMVADDDVFFPGKEAVKKAEQIFRNLQEVYILQDCKHMPGIEHFPLIQAKLRKWLQ